MDTNQQFHLSQEGKKYLNEDPGQTRNLTEHEESFQFVDLFKSTSAILRNEESLQIWGMDKKQVLHLSQESKEYSNEDPGQTGNLFEHEKSFQPGDLLKSTSTIIRNEESLLILNMDTKQVFHSSQEGNKYSNEDSGQNSNLIDREDSLQPLEKSKTTSAVISKGNLFHYYDISPKSFYKKDDLATHRLTHTVQKCVCGICKREFALQDELEAHCLSHKIGNKFVCHVCEQSFLCRSNLQRHLVNHNTNKCFICDICDKSFKRKSELSRHMSTHTGKKPYICKICQKAFSRKNRLNLHLMIHRQDKPFECDICGETFYENEILKIHRHTHSNIKLAACNICQKSYATDYIKNHMLTHAPENKRICRNSAKGLCTCDV